MDGSARARKITGEALVENFTDQVVLTPAQKAIFGGLAFNEAESGERAAGVNIFGRTMLLTEHNVKAVRNAWITARLDGEPFAEYRGHQVPFDVENVNSINKGGITPFRNLDDFIICPTGSGVDRTGGSVSVSSPG